MARGRGIPIVPIRPLKRRSDGELVYASSGIPYKNGDRMQRYKHEAQVILRNSIYGNYLLCGSCSNRGTCAGIRHCTRRSSGEKLPAYDPAR